MINLLISIFIVICLLALFYWAVHRIGAAFGFPTPQILVILDIFLVVIGVLYCLSLLAGAPVWRLR